MFQVGTVDYYAVDHTHFYLWESASRSVSAALVVHLPAVLPGREAWQQSETLRRAIAIDREVVLHPSILAFQNRRPEYPHEPISLSA